MGTAVEIVISHHQESTAEEAIEAAFDEIRRLETEMSGWRSDSELSLINRCAGEESITVSDSLFHIISSAQEISFISEGAFDITVAVLKDVWDFHQDDPKIPDSIDITEKLPLIKYRNIIIDNTKKSVFLKRPGMRIGLGGIAKGYAVDRAMQVIRDRGVRNAIVQLGGDIRLQGKRDGQLWDVGIQHPRERDGFIGKISLSNISISTSGDYEKYFVVNGKRYHHIIDPVTGYPARLCQSVTIVAPDTMTSDALSTTVFVLGPEKGMRLIERLKGIEGLIIDMNGKLIYSTGFSERFLSVYKK